MATSPALALAWSPERFPRSTIPSTQRQQKRQPAGPTPVEQ